MATLKAKLESLLFISTKPLTLKKLAELTKKEKEEVGEALKGLIEDYQGKGIEVKKVDDKFQMMTSGDCHGLAQDFVKDEISGELTRPSLETLTVIAYRGPVSKPELEMIRGVNCSMIIRNLLMRGLIEEMNDKGRGELYRVTMEFMKLLKISEPADLPDYDKLNSDENLQKLLSGELNNDDEEEKEEEEGGDQS